VNTKSSLAEQLKAKEYRDALVASSIRIGLPMQCRTLRESRTWTQPQLAEAAGMTQPRISEIERPGERKLNIETLLRLASAFDVALQVRFVPFSQFVDDDDSIDFDNYYVRPYEEDIEQLEKREEQMKSVLQLKPSGASKAAQPEDSQRQQLSTDALNRAAKAANRFAHVEGNDQGRIDNNAGFIGRAG
jgi:transcriptional regulator with XRE-family HTH domain